ncbi:hypothetical protein [Teredinibacter turnerae]|uniref:Uncharacterized protein n=1 Tax=Teredinibacter turnerae (strain ATCC 39867 / T7901) TaxID=377629 RepID=C5BK14_TERTT|nr:hypothetical protein [Teredinibacter turnerae]ACR14303.1 hypothetical protein TERTU_2257 [Teredinibacter turnerae T7901]
MLQELHTLTKGPLELDIDGETFILKTYLCEIPEGLFELRKMVYGEEQAFLKEDQLLLPEDYTCHHVCVYHSGILVAAMVGMPVDQSPYPEMTGATGEELQSCYFSSKGIVHPEYRSRFRLWPLLTYLTFLHGTKSGYNDNLSLFENKSFVELLMDVEWLSHLPDVFYEGDNHRYQLFPARVNLKYGAEEAWEVLDPSVQNAMQENRLTLA